MRKKRTRTPVMFALAGLLASLMTIVSSGTASAAESIPELQWPAVSLPENTSQLISGVQGGVTVPCGQTDLTTYNTSGDVARQIDRTTRVNDVLNCISYPQVDKNGDLYGALYGAKSDGSSGLGPVLAYSGNTLKWSYVTGCDSAQGYIAQPAVGADGNIYVIDGNDHLLGLTPEAAPGQTQPAKVLDVPVNNQCGDRLYPYKDGIAVFRGQDYSVRYYSYGGKDLGQPSGNYRTGVPVLSAEGRLFYRTYVGSSPRSASITAYDPTTGTAWTTSVSTPGANAQGVSSLALPGGGALAIAREQRMTADGIPVTPEEYVTTLVTLNGQGQKVSTKRLFEKNADGDSYQSTSYAVDTSGKVVISRQLKQTLAYSPGSVPVTEITVFDAASGDITYQENMRGNTTQGEEIYGYRGSLSAIGPNTAYIGATKCSGSCATQSGPKLYPIKVPGLGLDYPRGAVLAKEKRPAALYRAFGDSFSAGEGVEPFEAGTATPNLNTCHRSDYAYPRLISGTSAKIPSLGSNGFRACSGAVTENITDAPQWNEGTQLDLPAWPDNSTQLVTMTIGGNDIKFGDFGKACVYLNASCDFGSSAYNTSLNEINNTLPAKLKATYERVLKYAPNAKVYVLGYPQVVANKSINDGSDDRCFYMQGGSSNWGEARAARDIVTKLNEAISDNVAAVRALNADYQRLKYVPLDGFDSPFVGHEVCGTASSSWFQNIDQATNDPAYVFHPNKLGYEGYATVAGAAINAG